MRLDPATRRLNLDPRDPGFYANPYAAYAEMHASPGPCVLGGIRLLVLLQPRQRVEPVARQAVRPADPACGDARGTRLAGASRPSRRFRRAGAPLAARTGAAGAHAAARAGQPRLRVAAGRAARPCYRRESGAADRRARARRRPDRGIRDADPHRRDRRIDRRAGRGQRADARLVAQNGRDVSVRPDPRRRGRRRAGRARFLSLCARPRRPAPPRPARRPDLATDRGRDRDGAGSARTNWSRP